MSENETCPKCQSENIEDGPIVNWKGSKPDVNGRSGGTKAHYNCNDCGHSWVNES